MLHLLSQQTDLSLPFNNSSTMCAGQRKKERREEGETERRKEIKKERKKERKQKMKQIATRKKEEKSGEGGAQCIPLRPLGVIVLRQHIV